MLKVIREVKIESLRNVKIRNVRYKRRIYFWNTDSDRLMEWLELNCQHRYNRSGCSVLFENKKDALLAYVALC